MLILKEQNEHKVTFTSTLAMVLLSMVIKAVAVEWIAFTDILALGSESL
jgi:hypothetical protein